MAVEEYIERLIIRQDKRPEVAEPTFCDNCLDREYEFEGVLKLVQILKSVQNTTHNQHDYVFHVVRIDKFKEED